MRAMTARGMRTVLGALRPVVLGQTGKGLLILAGLLLLWQLSDPVRAQAQESGYSENAYFRLEWNYDLATGTGVITMWPLQDGRILLFDANFVTVGVLLDSIWVDGSEYGEPIELGVVNGRAHHYYPLLSAVSLESPLHIDLTFPTVNTALRTSYLTYSGHLSAPSLNLGIPPQAAKFVTVQAIPSEWEDADLDGVADGEDACPNVYSPEGVNEDGRPNGDLDRDCDVDLIDFMSFAKNFTGS